MEKEGVEVGNCDGCGIEPTRSVPVLEPEPEPTTTAAPETQPTETVKPVDPPKKKSHLPLGVAFAVVVVCSVLLVILLVQESNRKRKIRAKKKGGKYSNR